MEVDKGNVGRIAERIVMNELEARGYHIIDLAYASRTFANVDFIASKNGRSFNVQVKATSVKPNKRRAVQYGYCNEELVADRAKTVFNGRTEAALRADVVVLVGVRSPKDYWAIVLPVDRAEECAQINIEQYYRQTKEDGSRRTPNKIFMELDVSLRARASVHPEKQRERDILLAHVDAWDLGAPPVLRDI